LCITTFAGCTAPVRVDESWKLRVSGCYQCNYVLLSLVCLLALCTLRVHIVCTQGLLPFVLFCAYLLVNICSHNRLFAFLWRVCRTLSANCAQWGRAASLHFVIVFMPWAGRILVLRQFYLPVGFCTWIRFLGQGVISMAFVTGNSILEHLFDGLLVQTYIHLSLRGFRPKSNWGPANNPNLLSSTLFSAELWWRMHHRRCLS